MRPSLKSLLDVDSSLDLAQVDVLGDEGHDIALRVCHGRSAGRDIVTNGLTLGEACIIRVSSMMLDLMGFRKFPRLGRGNIPVGLAMATAARARTVMMENCILNDDGVYKIFFLFELAWKKRES